MNDRPVLLVVDNEIDICNFVRSFFEDRGMEVAAAMNSDQALVYLSEKKPDVVLLDIVMRRDREGLECLPLIKGRSPYTKVVMVTAAEDRETFENARNLGADGFLTKPVCLEHLEKTVLRMLGRKFFKKRRSGAKVCGPR